VQKRTGDSKRVAQLQLALARAVPSTASASLYFSASTNLESALCPHKQSLSLLEFFE
jgi:hypothetical protein